MSPPRWRQILRTNFTKWKELSTYLRLPDLYTPVKSRHFPLNLPRRLAEKIQKGDPHDPILRQFLPTSEEKEGGVSYTHDPVGDGAARIKPRLLQKYQGRCLLMPTSACAMHCRYCFRQHFDYAQGPRTYEEELRMIAADPSLHEVILSGGDPLSLLDEELQALIESLQALPHVRRLRFHTRFPIGIPERLDNSFLKLLEATRLQVWFVIHANHALELDNQVIEALRGVARLGIPLLSQSVLLAGVNDSQEALGALCERLISGGITPYYLHQLDRVKGASRFAVSEARGHQLIKALRDRLPGYAIPTFVQEVAGDKAKRTLHPGESLNPQELEPLSHHPSRALT